MLSDQGDKSVLKIADFGLSAVVFAASEMVDDRPAFSPVGTPTPKHRENSSNVQFSPTVEAAASTPTSGSSPALRRLKSVVGSPHYAAPEITEGG